MRILLSNKSRIYLFEQLKIKYGVKKFTELANSMKVSLKTMQKWRLGERYIPNHIIPKEIKNLKIITRKEDNWGQIKGGQVGGRKSVESQKKKLGEKRYSEMMSQRGTKIINSLWEKRID